MNGDSMCDFFSGWHCWIYRSECILTAISSDCSSFKAFVVISRLISQAAEGNAQICRYSYLYGGVDEAL